MHITAQTAEGRLDEDTEGKKKIVWAKEELKNNCHCRACKICSSYLYQSHVC